MEKNMPKYLMKELDELFISDADDDADAQEIAAMWGGVVIRRLTPAEEAELDSQPA
jgi:hypothetical protein